MNWKTVAYWLLAFLAVAGIALAFSVILGYFHLSWPVGVKT